MFDSKGLGGASSLGPSQSGSISRLFFFWTSSYAFFDDFPTNKSGRITEIVSPSMQTSVIHQGGLKGCRSWFWFNGGGAITPDTWPWGWTSLDRLWRLVLGEVTVVTGIPGHGKSEFLLSLAVSWWSLGGNIGIQENWGWKHLVVKGPLFTNKSTGMSQESWTLL